MNEATGAALLPWIVGVAFALCSLIWAQIKDDGARIHRRRFAAQALAELGWNCDAGTRYVRGQSVMAMATAVASGVATPTVFPPLFLPEPLEPGPDSPIGGEVDDDTVPLPAEPAPSHTGAHRRWPTPVVLPQPQPTAEAVLFEKTGAYPVLDEAVLHSGMTGAFPRLTPEVLAEFDATLKAGAR